MDCFPQSKAVQRIGRAVGNAIGKLVQHQRELSGASLLSAVSIVAIQSQVLANGRGVCLQTFGLLWGNGIPKTQISIVDDLRGILCVVQDTVGDAVAERTVLFCRFLHRFFRAV